MSRKGLLVLNAGSSSLKFAVYEVTPDGPAPWLRGQVGGIGGTPEFSAAMDDDGTVEGSPLSGEEQDHAAVLDRLLAWLHDRVSDMELTAAGHRVVHGGPDLAEPVAIDEAVLERLAALIPLAPLHQPHNLAPIRALRARMPALPQVACFDTAFHRTQPEVAQRFALPRWLTDEGVRRYGFHGLSYEAIAAALAEEPDFPSDGRVAVAHLGHGASICAMEGRRSVATTMGFTALDGLPMGRRCGNVDPGVLLYLLDHHGMSVEAVADLLYTDSGLYGVSGLSSDVRDLLASDAPEAEEAIALFCYRAARELGSLAAALGGLDGLVFTAGIGENQPEIRRRIVAQAAWLGAAVDPAANEANARDIAAAGSRVALRVIPTDEEAVIARQTLALARDGGAM